MPRLHALIALVVIFAAGTARAQNFFDIRGRAASDGIATFDYQQAGPAEPASPMLDRLDGVIGRLSRADIRALRACIAGPVGKVTGLDDAALVCVLHLRSGPDTLTVEIRRTAAGDLLARRGTVPGEKSTDKMNARADQEGRIGRLDDDRFFQLSRRWSRFQGTLHPDGPPDLAPGPGEPQQLDPPVHGWVTFTKEELGDRLLRGRRTRVDGATRLLADDEIWARAPQGYDPRHPAGLLVWVHASPNGRPPAAIFDAADELGLVCVSQADAGNECPIADRYQRIFDAVATAATRYHLDPRRIYISGISGGGKVSSVLWACFPDLFAGSVPIVGLACYENIPIGNGQIWPGLYDKPKAPVFSLLKEQRCAAITGPKDFNYDSIIAVQKVLARDGLSVRVFEHADLAHTMPTPAQFAEALRWVDEPFRNLRAGEHAAAERLLAEFKARAGGDSPPDPDERRRLLIEITRAGPWTSAAWEAADLLSSPQAPRSALPAR